MRVSLILILVFAVGAHAAPWDTDLYKQQSYKANEIARSPMPDTYPLGYKPYSKDNFELADTLKNPVEADRDSLWSGQRLYNSNCAVCHNKNGQGGMPVAEWLAIPNITLSAYADKTDGWVFGVIKNGQGSMPRYGYKFSDKEHWDIINYVRFLQGKVSSPDLEIPEE